jgi:hypothetical protein
MSAKEIFSERLAAIQLALTERGEWFAWYPVRAPRKWVWLRRVSYIRYFDQDACGFVTVYSTGLQS